MNILRFHFITRWLFFWITSLCFLYASENEECDSLWTITSHKAGIAINPPAGSFSVIDTIIIKPSGVGTFCLRIMPLLSIKSITRNGEELTYLREGEKITSKEMHFDDETEIVIHTEGILTRRSEFSGISENGALLRLDEILASARSEYNFIRFTIRVPAGWEAIGPGELAGVLAGRDYHINIWECSEPVPILGWICAGEYRKSEIQNGGITFSACFAPDDSNETAPILRLASDAIRFFSTRFTSYRFNRFTVVEVDNWVAGNAVLAIAAPAFVMVKRFAFTTDDPFNRVESILAHEIAHQWWPLTVSMHEQDLPFLSEGMCEFSAGIYNRSAGRESGRDSLGNHPLLRPLILRILRGEETPLWQKTDMRSSQTHYLKGAYVHQMLNEILGEKKSEVLYRNFAQKYSGKVSGIEDFITSAESLSGRNLKWFFDQWLKGINIPRMKIYNVKVNRENDTWTSKGRVRIVGYEKFTTLVTVRADDGGEGGEMEVLLGLDSTGTYRNDVPFSIITSGKPEYIILDPHDRVLKFKKLPPKLADLREAAGGKMIIGTDDNYRELRRMAENDSARMAMSGWFLEIISDTSATLTDLQKTRVFLYGKPGENRIVREMEDKFPYRFNADSLVIGNEAVLDTSLSCVQIIDNPFIEHGLLVWIAPLGPNVPSNLLPYDASWIILRGRDEVEKGVWSMVDEDLVVDVR